MSEPRKAMTRHQETRCTPYSPEQMFDLVIDIERYRNFMPGYRSARIVRRADPVLQVEQTIGLGGMRWTFGSVATLRRPEHILIQSSDGPFRRLDIEWRFLALPAGCRIVFMMAGEFRSPLLERMAGHWIGALGKPVVSAFLREAARRYGQPSKIRG